MKLNPWVLLVVTGLAIASAVAPIIEVPASTGEPGVTEVPSGYRDWRLVSVAREEGKLDDIRAVLGNDAAISAYREDKLPFPNGAIIARLAWSYEASAENNAVFDRPQSSVAGHPKNGVQFMVKDSAKYAATGGWGYGHFEDGKPASAEMIVTCHSCHAKLPTRDFVFTRYAR